MLTDSDPEGEKPFEISEFRCEHLNEGFATMIDKLMGAALLVPDCIASDDPDRLDRCRTLTHEARAQQAALTRSVLLSQPPGHVFHALIHLPFLLQRIGDKLEFVVNTSQATSQESRVLDDKARAHLQQLLAILTDMMSNLRDAFVVRDSLLVQSIISEGNELKQMLLDERSTSWPRPRLGRQCFQPTVTYLEILDAIKSACEDVDTICARLRDLETTTPAASTAREGAEGIVDERGGAL